MNTSVKVTGNKGNNTQAKHLHPRNLKIALNS